MEFTVNRGSNKFFLIENVFDKEFEPKEIPPITDYPFAWRAYDDDKEYCGQGFFQKMSEDNYSDLLKSVASMWGAVRCVLYDRSTGKIVGEIE